IVNYDSFLRSENFIKAYDPKFIIHFGRPLTSPRIEKFTQNKSIPVFIVNIFGDFRIKRAVNKIVALEEKDFLENLIAADYQIETNKSIKALKEIDLFLEQLKSKVLFETVRINEVQILSEVLNAISPNSNVMIGNSVPIRDMDFLSSS